jgi:hypothetical protein
MGHDAVKIMLMDHIMSPDLDLSIIKAIQAYMQCKNFRPACLNTLLQLIMHWHPFELLVGDYLLMLSRKGRYHTLTVYLDTFSQHVWAFKYKTIGTMKISVNTLSTISKAFIAPKTFMTDGDTYFNNAITVQEFCDTYCYKHHVIPTYLPWSMAL